MSEELKPCPFCGEKGEIMRLNYIGRCYCQCSSCGCETVTSDTMKEAVEKWNRRVKEK